MLQVEPPTRGALSFFRPRSRRFFARAGRIASEWPSRGHAPADLSSGFSVTYLVRAKRALAGLNLRRPLPPQKQNRSMHHVWSAYHCLCLRAVRRGGLSAARSWPRHGPSHQTPIRGPGRNPTPSITGGLTLSTTPANPTRTSRRGNPTRISRPGKHHAQLQVKASGSARVGRAQRAGAAGGCGRRRAADPS